MFSLLLMALFMGQSVQPAEPIQNVGSVQQTCVQEEPIVEAKTQAAQQTSIETVTAEPAVKQESIGIIKMFGRLESPDVMINKILTFAENPMIKGILLVVDSGGGTIGSAELLCREIQELSRQKPVVTLVVNCCTSAAYWIASATDWIVAQESSDIGGIGVKFTIEKHSNCKQNSDGYESDLDVTVICAGRFKGISDPNTAPMNEKDRAYEQERLDNLYNIFTSQIAKNRPGLSLEKVMEWADGKQFTGVQALQKGLIDQVGGHSDAVKKLNELIADRGIVVTQKLALVG